MNRKVIKSVVLSGLFLAALIVFSIITNQDNKDMTTAMKEATLPIVQFYEGNNSVAQLHGYVSEMNITKMQDGIVPVDHTRLLPLKINTYGQKIRGIAYEIRSLDDSRLVAKGNAQEIKEKNNEISANLKIQNILGKGEEYELIVILASGKNKIRYYTRLMQTQNDDTQACMDFALQFHEYTFRDDANKFIPKYMDAATGDTSTLNYVDLSCTLNQITWADLKPEQMGELEASFKEINDSYDVITLRYVVTTKGTGGETEYYNVEEYYRLRWTDSKIYLLDFERQMSEDMNLSKVSIDSGALRLGIGSADDVQYAVYGTQEQQYTYIVSNGQLWLYDGTNKILTKVYADADEGHNCGHEDDCEIKVIHADPDTGDLYFIVYGYMHSGNYEGREGIMVNHFSHGDVMLEEMIFIPFDKGFEQMRSGLEELAYMNSNNEAYLMLEDCVYKIDVSLGRMEKVWDNLNSSNCTASDKGIFVMSEGGNDYGGDSLKLIDLNTGKEQTISGSGQLITPLGYAGEDLVYGLIDPDLVKEDSTGVIQAPVSEIHIVDGQLNDVKSYSKSGDYVMRLTISEGNISMKLAKAVSNGDYTDYEDDGEDYIIRNIEASDSTVYVDRLKDGTRGIQNWLYLGTSDSFVPITQIARYLDPGYDISKKYESSDNVEMQYYVYTKGRMAASFNTIQEAVEYGNTYAGTIMTSHKQVLWQRAGRAYIWDLNIDSIDKADSQTGINQILINKIASYEGWELKSEADDSQPLFAAMSDALPAETIDLTGLELTDVLHFVYRDRLVAVKISDSDYALITAYDTNAVWLADPVTGEVSSMSQSAAETLFKQYGKVYYSYMD